MWRGKLGELCEKSGPQGESNSERKTEEKKTK
jgi:hypothetical protein